jgi:hypothetical protein
MNNLNSLLARSAELEKALMPYIQIQDVPQSDRLTTSRMMCGVAFEHAESVKILIVSGNFTSALGLIRLQYEALLRALWFCYAASDEAISKILRDFTRDNFGKSEKLPMPAEMLTSLEGKAPQGAMISLYGFKENSWKPLSSYVHGGAHALHRHSMGYPPTLLADTLRASNALSMMTAMLAQVLSGKGSIMGSLRGIQATFADCLPQLAI